MDAHELAGQLRQRESLAAALFALRTQEQGDWHAPETLLQMPTLESLLQDFARGQGHPDGDRRAIASLWSRWHFWAVLPPFMAALALHRHVPQVRALLLGPDRRTCAVQWWDSPRALRPHTLQTQCESIVHDAAPLIQALATASRLSPKVLWGNVGTLLDYMLTQLHTQADASQTVLKQFGALLTEPSLADATPNPLYQAVRPESAGTSVRRRKICCLYYALPGFDLCGNCPRIKSTIQYVPT
ncbi:MAG TPA: siderophore-iron reductase FhuF [Alcaligenes sp.]|nr:siderophore-iron reductase FhuF [Alcaligenes faecalis]HRL20307.1 siderophore-iron reductase FhuF [Alcaligenes sp.]